MALSGGAVALLPAGAFLVRDGLGGGAIALAAGFVLIGFLAGLVAGRRLRRLLERQRQDSETLREEEVRRSRALLSNAERVAQLGSAERDLRTGQSRWSDEFHAILGLIPGECRPSRMLFLDCVLDSDRPAVEQALESVARDGRRMERTFRIVRPDGEVRALLGQAELGRDEDGSPVRLDITIQDITERKRLEGELDGLIRELWRSNEELEQFAYVTSHDLRQPLRVVNSYVSLMEEELQGSLTGETQEYMAFVRDGVRRMDRLITDLLTYSRVGRTAADQAVAMGDAIQSALTDLQFEIEDAEADIRISGSPPVVLGDESEMGRLFLNLIGNAIKYRRPDHQPEIEVRIDETADAWRIAISDNGIGIPAEHAERVFGIFQRLHARDEFEGTGVGLAIVKKIVERHGGTIMVESRDGPGATIVFTWPKLHAPLRGGLDQG
ncbi:ATP-binding protein [Magnetospirillum sp. SS-4]|uniref:sensor histidine kinase n=1 Tax=Magnetospirillum sp. SS-4 TaxID=2681465 RepID=UPI0015740944|nr:PAS domain-containing sensor histidine kinase [Magnetospirillum sp. SS-4]